LLGRSLKDIPFSEIKEGMRVIGAHGGFGTILGTFSPPQDREDSVDIKWDNGNTSGGIFHCWLDKVFEVL